MNKQKFISKLKTELRNNENKAEIISYYEELIDEALSSGKGEVEFINSLGEPKRIVADLTNDHTNQLGSPKANVSKNSAFGKVVVILAKIGYYFVLVSAFFIILSIFGSSLSTLIQFIIFLVSDTSGLNLGVIAYNTFNLLTSISLTIIGVFALSFLGEKERRFYNIMVKKLNNYFNLGGK